MSRRTAAAFLIVFGLAACDQGSSAEVPTARSLAKQLERAGVCTDAHRQPMSGDAPTQYVQLMGKTWSCDAPSSDNNARGGIEVGLWTGTAAAKAKVLRQMATAEKALCAPRGVFPDAPAGTRMISKYVEGKTWLAFVGINARFHDVASTLHGRPVTKQCFKR